MPLAMRRATDPMPALAPLAGLVVRREERASVMAALQGRDVAQMARRFEAGHRAYVAMLHDERAAWGWVATRTAEIGELGSTFPIATAERYLWNFVTLTTHRGMGIYPRLLDAIVVAEANEAARFWVAYAPENHASGAGIAKAGFSVVADLSFDAAGHAAVRGVSADAGRDAARAMALPLATVALAPCWRCVRAGKPADSACREGQCCCDYQRPERACVA